MTDRQITHSPDCWGWGPRHYECAVMEIEALRAKVAKWKRIAAMRAGLHDESEARVKQLAAALKSLHAQAAQDEALLRQALEALEFSDWYTRAKAKSTIAALRERLAETANDLTRCPNCGGPADNGHDREVPPNPYWCSKCSE